MVKQLTGLQINHVVNINFTGFADAVNAIGCVYVDVDRRYYIPEEDETSEINLEAGYQRMCGFNALQYVRFRHFDNDLVRAARQQDFLREARQKLPPEKLIEDRNELLDIFTEYTTSDIGEAVQLLELLKTFAAVQSAPVTRGPLPGRARQPTYVTASDDAIQAAVEQFLAAEGTPGERPAGEQPPPDEDVQSDGSGGEDKPQGATSRRAATTRSPRRTKPENDFVGPAMDDSTEMGQTYAKQMSAKRKKDGDPMVDFPIYYPTRLAPGSFLARDSRAFVIDGPDKDVYYGYKMVADVPGDTFGHGLLDEYYGISGTDWVDAPILDNPSETRTIDGKDYLLFYDGDRLRLVGWKTRQGRLLGQQHAAAVARRGSDALDRDLDARVRRQVASRVMEREREAADRRHRGRLGRPGHRAPASPRSAIRWSRSTSTPRRSRRCAPARRCRSTSPGCPSWSSETASGCTFTTEMDEVAGRRPAAVLLRRHAADLLRRRRPLAGRGGGRGAPRRRRARAGDEEHRARRHRRGDPPLASPTSSTSPVPSSSRRARRSTTSSSPTGS